jgi:hypothetical protein
MQFVLRALVRTRQFICRHPYQIARVEATRVCLECMECGRLTAGWELYPPRGKIRLT